MSYLDTIKQGAINAWYTSQILPSIAGAQAILETGSGTSSLAKPPYNNHFGIKASADWTGKKISMPTREFSGGAWITVNADFRWYDTITESFEDYGAFFTNTPWRVENYKHVVGETDYKRAAWALQNAGYATDPQYATKLITRIENNNLQAWDVEALSSNVTKPPTSNQPILTPAVKTVGGSLTSIAKETVKELNITVIGDSLGVGTRTHFQTLAPKANYDVVGSRQITHATDSLNGTKVLTDMKNGGTLREYVVVILGTNRGVTQAEVDNFISIAGLDRKILFVDTASEVNHAPEVSNQYRQASVKHTNAFYVNWAQHAKPMMAGWYSTDGAGGTYIHMTSEGYRNHAEYIAQAVYQASVGTFTGEVATPAETTQIGIKDIDLTIDGTVKFKGERILDDGTTVVVDETTNIGVEGLYSPLGDENIYYPEANAKWGGTGSINNSLWIEGRFELPDEGDPIKLIKSAATELINRGQATVQYTISLADMPVDVSIGDTGIFRDHEFNPPLYIRARVLQITTSKTNPNANQVVIGNATELIAQDKSAILAIQKEIKQSTERLKRETMERQPISAQIISTNGFVLGDAYNETQLIASLKRGVDDVTQSVTRVSWERVSNNDEADNSYNQQLESVTSGTLTVLSSDIPNGYSKYVARMYNEAEQLIQQTNISLKKVESALWVEPTQPTDAKPGSVWVKPDGTQMLNTGEEWEERVDQRVASEIVNRDGVTVSFSDVAPSNGGKQGDVWFKLNSDGSQSIMRHDGTEWFETVTNALNADGIMTGTMDFSLVNAIHINAASITAGHGDFLSIALTALNSKATLDGAALRFTNDDGGFIEMNSVPEIRSTAADSTSVLLDSGRLHFYDKLGMSKGYFGTDIHDGTRDFGIWLSKGSGIFRFARMADAQSTESKYYTVEPGDQRVAVITKLVQRGELPDGNQQDFINKSNMIAQLNGWAILPQEWPTLVTGQQIKYQEEVVTTEGDAYDDIYRIGTSTQGDWRFYHDKYVVFEGGTSLSSDRRIKENIQPTDVVALDDIDAFDFVQFDMIKTGIHTEIGMIAQDAGRLRVIDETEGIDLQGSIMLALKGVQELHQIIKTQQEQINLLEERLNEER